MGGAISSLCPCPRQGKYDLSTPTDSPVDHVDAMDIHDTEKQDKLNSACNNHSNGKGAFMYSVNLSSRDTPMRGHPLIRVHLRVYLFIQIHIKDNLAKTFHFCHR